MSDHLKPSLKITYSLCITNGEMYSGTMAHEFNSAGGIDAIIYDHVWDQKNFENEIEELILVFVDLQFHSNGQRS